MKTTAPLTKSQYGIYAECIAHQGEVCYQITYLYTLDGGVDEQKLKAAIESAVAAHPTLFTRIGLNEQATRSRYSMTASRSAWRWSTSPISRRKSKE